MEKPNSNVPLAGTVATRTNAEVIDKLMAGVAGADANPNGTGRPVPRLPLPEFDKKAVAKLSRQYNMHYLLIMEQDGLTKPNAQFKAWLEGPEGLTYRMDGPHE